MYLLIQNICNSTPTTPLFAIDKRTTNSLPDGQFCFAEKPNKLFASWSWTRARLFRPRRLGGNLCAGVSDTPLLSPRSFRTSGHFRRAGFLPLRSPQLENYEMHPRTEFDFASGFPLRSDNVDTFSLAGELFIAGGARRRASATFRLVRHHESLELNWLSWGLGTSSGALDGRPSADEVPSALALHSGKNRWKLGY